jgi:hypothetical protein
MYPPEADFVEFLGRMNFGIALKILTAMNE